MPQLGGHRIYAAELANDVIRLLHQSGTYVRYVQKVNVENVQHMRDRAREKRMSPKGDLPVKVTEELRKLRQRAGLSMAEMAQELGYKTASGYQRYENAEEYTKDNFPITFVHKLLGVLKGRGTPPIGMEEVMILSGITEGMTTEGLFSYAGSLLPIFPSRIPVSTLENLPTILSDQSFTAEGTVRISIKGHVQYTACDGGQSSGSFCIEVTDISMIAAVGEKHSFTLGDRIICDPEAEIRPSDFVIAKREADRLPVFRRYRVTGHDDRNAPIVELIALNQDFPTLPINQANPGKILARVVEHRVRL